MSELDIVRAMKDEEYRASLSAEVREQLPESPAGAVQLDDEDLNAIAAGYHPGGGYTYTNGITWCCW
ncbi:MAG TPA: mersacidin/lichenicidin family type 2 lantibiotic [Chloroflexia bacterium]|nr:mersacidin/lichenicidin family type 2 lantibiotic [Chloroflexia bacterium]